MAVLPGLANISEINKNPLPLSLSLKAQEYFEILKKSSIVIVKILMLYIKKTIFDKAHLPKPIQAQFPSSFPER
jgi:hypothetical protein